MEFCQEYSRLHTFGINYSAVLAIQLGSLAISSYGMLTTILTAMWIQLTHFLILLLLEDLLSQP
jgi:hypothetical protein